jgi:hypothetical protein
VNEEELIKKWKPLLTYHGEDRRIFKGKVYKIQESSYLRVASKMEERERKHLQDKSNKNKWGLVLVMMEISRKINQSF